MEFNCELILQKRFHKGPNPPKHENHTGSYQGSQIQCREGLGSTDAVPNWISWFVWPVPAKTQIQHQQGRAGGAVNNEHNRSFVWEGAS